MNAINNLLSRWNDKIIAIFGLLNFGFVVLGFLLFVIVFFIGADPLRQEYIRLIPRLIVSAIIYFGIVYRKSWVLLLIWITLSFGFIQGLLIPVENVVALVVKIIGLSFGIFWIYFFTRKQVREYFHYQGITLF